MSDIKIIERHFIVDLSESEAASVVLYLRKSNVISSPAYKVAEKLEKALGYTPQEDIY